MQIVVQHAPRLDRAEATRLARDLYGVAGPAEPLPSERDQNFHFRAAGGEFVLKIANATERREVLELQNKALAYLDREPTGLALPRCVASLAGREIESWTAPDGRTHFVRLLTWVPGVPLAAVRPHSESILQSLGRRLAVLDRALAGFEDPAMHRPLAWNLRHAAWALDEVGRIPNASTRVVVGELLPSVLERLEPAWPSLAASVIHNDWNDDNVLVSPPGPHREVIGVVDFGDMVYSATVADLAVAAAYAMLDKADPLAAATPLVAGYHAERPLSEAELAVLFDLILARLCLSVTMAACQGEQAPDNSYLQTSQARVAARLADLAGASPEWAHYMFRSACGLVPCPKGRRVGEWLEQHVDGIGPLTSGGLTAVPHATVDLSPGSLQLSDPAIAFDPARFARHVASLQQAAGAGLGIGRYGEIRLAAMPESWIRNPESGCVHLGLDLYLPSGTPVLAPLEGVVRVARVQAAAQGGEAVAQVEAVAQGGKAVAQGFSPAKVILEHQAGEAGLFYTIYDGLDPDSVCVREGDLVGRGDVVGRVAGPMLTGGWPPRLHVQIVADLLGFGAEFPALAPSHERDVWLSIAIDPSRLAGLTPDRASVPPPRQADLLARRRRRLGPNLSISYRRPLTIVRGFLQYLFDEEGRRYLDAANNVQHVGHCHPRVARAVAGQSAVLTTNTRYLHDRLVEYAERLTALLPDPLRVCYFVCSGSEANELALRLARAATGADDLVVVDAAYHGNTTTLIDISPYKAEGPGGRGLPPWVHKVPLPDVYRGLYRDPATAGRLYAGTVAAAVGDIHRQGRRPAAFICESLPSCAGQIVLPDGYLAAAYEAIRAAGGVTIADEVQVGFGRLGDHTWGFELQGVVPDIVTMGKPIGNGFPLGAVVTTPAIAAAFDNGMEYFNTFGGNPVAAAAGLAVLDVLEDERLPENAVRVGGYLLDRLRALAERHPVIGDVRGRGLFIGVELVTDRERRTPAGAEAAYVADRLRECGVLVGTDGPDHNVLKIKPPLVFSAEDADRLAAALDEVLGEDFPAGRYTFPVMRSVADDLRRDSRARMLARSPGERIRIALDLGDADVRLFAAARGISADEARSAVARRRQTGRRPSACHRALEP